MFGVLFRQKSKGKGKLINTQKNSGVNSSDHDRSSVNSVYNLSLIEKDQAKSNSLVNVNIVKPEPLGSCKPRVQFKDVGYDSDDEEKVSGLQNKLPTPRLKEKFDERKILMKIAISKRNEQTKLDSISNVSKRYSNSKEPVLSKDVLEKLSKVWKTFVLLENYVITNELTAKKLDSKRCTMKKLKEKSYGKALFGVKKVLHRCLSLLSESSEKLALELLDLANEALFCIEKSLESFTISLSKRKKQILLENLNSLDLEEESI